MDAPKEPTNISSPKEISIYSNWEHFNRLNIMIMKSKITKNICKSILDSSKAKELLATIKQQFKTSNKALTCTFIRTLTTKRYDWINGIHEHIMEISNIAKQLKALDMTIIESFLVQFILNPFFPQFGPFKISCNI